MAAAYSGDLSHPSACCSAESTSGGIRLRPAGAQGGEAGQRPGQ